MHKKEIKAMRHELTRVGEKLDREKYSNPAKYKRNEKKLGKAHRLLRMLSR